jgi:hypothetical protein
LDEICQNFYFERIWTNQLPVIICCVVKEEAQKAKRRKEEDEREKNENIGMGRARVEMCC